MVQVLAGDEERLLGNEAQKERISAFLKLASSWKYLLIELHTIDAYTENSHL